MHLIKQIEFLLKSENSNEKNNALDYSIWYIEYYISNVVPELASYTDLHFTRDNIEENIIQLKEILLDFFVTSTYEEKSSIVISIGELQDKNNITFFQNCLIESVYNLEHDYIINTLQALRDCKEPIKLNQEKFAKQINIVANLSNIMQYLNVNTLETNETIYVQKVDKNNILKLKANIIEVKENKLSKLKYTVSISLKLIYNENLEIYSSNIQFEQLIKYYYQQLAKISTLKYPQENFYFELENQNSSFKIILSEKINQSSFVSLFDNFIFKVVGYCYLKFNINLEKKIENIFLNELIKHTKILYSNELYSIKDVINMINSKDHKIQNKGLDLSYCIIKLFFHRKIPNDFMEFALQDTPTINDIHKLELLSSSNYP